MPSQYAHRSKPPICIYGIMALTACGEESSTFPADVDGKIVEKTVVHKLFSPENSEVRGKWRANIPLPKIGDRVHAYINKLGPGEVVAYFIEHGYLGIEVNLDNQPDWHVKQRGRGGHCLIFALETQP